MILNKLYSLCLLAFFLLSNSCPIAINNNEYAEQQQGEAYEDTEQQGGEEEEENQGQEEDPSINDEEEDNFAKKKNPNLKNNGQSHGKALWTLLSCGVGFVLMYSALKELKKYKKKKITKEEKIDRIEPEPLKITDTDTQENQIESLDTNVHNLEESVASIGKIANEDFKELLKTYCIKYLFGEYFDILLFLGEKNEILIKEYLEIKCALRKVFGQIKHLDQFNGTKSEEDISLFNLPIEKGSNWLPTVDNNNESSEIIGGIKVYKKQDKYFYRDIFTLNDNKKEEIEMINYKEIKELARSIDAVGTPLIHDETENNLQKSSLVDFLQVYYNLVRATPFNNNQSTNLILPMDTIKKYNNFAIGKIKSLKTVITMDPLPKNAVEKQDKKDKLLEKPCILNCVSKEKMPLLQIKEFDMTPHILGDVSLNPHFTQEARNNINQYIQYLFSLHIHHNIREIIGPLSSPTNIGKENDDILNTNRIIPAQLQNITQYIDKTLVEWQSPNSVENHTNDPHLKAFFIFNNHFHEKIRKVQTALYKKNDYGANKLENYEGFKWAIINMLCQ